MSSLSPKVPALAGAGIFLERVRQYIQNAARPPARPRLVLPPCDSEELMSDTPETAYRVLARKYRPETFADLVGQDAMVRTLKNAFEADRIAQAFIMTGIRGTGKTTTCLLYTSPSPRD